MNLVFISEHAKKYLNRLYLPEDCIFREVPKTFTDVNQLNVTFENIIAIGSSRVIDYAKLFSKTCGLKLVAIPTEISTDVLFTDTTAVRKNGWVTYIKSKKPDNIVLDTAILLENKQRCNYGWLEILAANTARFGLLEFNLGEQLLKFNDELLELIKYITPIEDETSLFLLLNSLAMEVSITEKAGSALCIEEGIEHYMTYALENKLPKRLMHGQYLVLTMGYLMDDERKVFSKLNIDDHYTNHGLTIEDMNDCYDLAMKKLKEDVTKTWLRKT